MKATKFSQYLQHREQLQLVDRPHWIYVLEATIWSIFIILVGLWTHNWIGDRFIIPALRGESTLNTLILNAIGYIALFFKWGSMAFAVFYFIKKICFYISTFVFASDRRLYFKTGLIRVLVFEMSFEEIQKTDINYGMIGRFLGYGKLILDARFVGDEDLPYTYKPETFGKLIHYNNDLSQDINLTFATKEMRQTQSRKEQIVTQREAARHVDPMHDQMDSVNYEGPIERDFSEKQENDKLQEASEQFDDDFDKASTSAGENDKKKKRSYKKPASSGFLK